MIALRSHKHPIVRVESHINIKQVRYVCNVQYTGVTCDKCMFMCTTVALATYGNWKLLDNASFAGQVFYV